MPPLYIVKQGAKLRLNNRRLVVEFEDQILASLPLGHVSQVILFGNIGLTTPAISAMLSRGISVVFLSDDGAYKGRLESALTPHVPIRRAQYRRLDDPDYTLRLAKAFVYAKISHQRALLVRHNQKRGDAEIQHCITQLGSSLNQIPRKTTLNALNGVEGTAGRIYFRGFQRLFIQKWGFERRNRRPPRDPVNVLLSLGYTLLSQLAFAAASTVGLDPYAGFLHQVVYNRPALALDLMEEFRPVVDGLVLWCLNTAHITKEDFQPGNSKYPILLSAEGKSRFLSAFEARFNRRFTHPIRKERLTLRQCLLEQARQVAHCVQQGVTDFRHMGFR